MLEKLDLDREIAKVAYKAAAEPLELQLGVLQRAARDAGIAVIIVFEGWGAAGKGTLINNLILPLDPRGFNVYSTLPPNEEEALRPFLWRFWIKTPARGRIAVFDRSWYRRVLQARLAGEVSGAAVEQAFDDIPSFERQLSNDGVVIIKFFLHISKKEQKRRFRRLEKNPATAWRVTEVDRRQNKKYEAYRELVEEALARTDTDCAPWTVVEAHDERFATLKVFTTVATALERALAEHQGRTPPPAERKPRDKVAAAALNSSMLAQVDLSLKLTRDAYRKALKQGQRRFRELEYEIYRRRLPVIALYEGWDAAGKGGNIRRVTGELDPRGYEVIPIAAPNDIEKAHHYLWRFWNKLPKAGHIAIFDRSWYGRLLVERVEGFCTEAEWRRAYSEINEMEGNLTHFGTVLVKFWLHIAPDEQLQRFNARQETDYKQWKITDEDWRNREKWDAYQEAVEEMLFRTSTPNAPWTIVESNDKWYARVKALETLVEAVEKVLG